MHTPELYRVRDFVRDNPGFTESQLRNYVNRAAENGMQQHGVIKRIGRSVFIDAPAFFKWVGSQQGGA